MRIKMIRISLKIDNNIESLWSTFPPAFLAPAVASSRRSFSSSDYRSATIRRTKIKYSDPRDAYKLRQAQARKDANLSRQAVLQERRKKDLGDPIRGISTPFVESFDSIAPQQAILDTDAINLEPLRADPDQPPPSTVSFKENHLNYGVNHEEFDRSIEYSRSLTEPLDSRQLKRWEARHAVASEAVQRIVSLASGSSEQRTKKNIERIIETFGRHNTDQTLKPKALASVERNPEIPVPQPTPRVGPDTGSSEVQIGILTAKIRVLADRYEGPNRNDKINKRNLRLLLHRRQKLLSYMEKKERGSERWQHMISTLGLTPATWKGQIAVQ